MNAGSDRDVMSRPFDWKSMARPRSCIDVPGRAVGGVHCDAGIW
jgi:hypothetical protein